MRLTRSRLRTRPLALLAAAALLAACDDNSSLPLAPDASLQSASLESASMQTAAAENRDLATLRRVTARYHDLNAALADGFILLHDCEVRPGEGAVGKLYVHLDRFLDGTLDAARPDGLLYATGADGGPRLAGVELALPMAMWSAPEPPEFLGVPLQAEEEFGAFGLHVWLWMHNPDGLFAQAHPGIACDEDSDH